MATTDDNTAAGSAVPPDGRSSSGWIGIARATATRPGLRVGLGVGLAVAAVGFAVALALDWIRFATGRAGNYDLGIFTQAAQRWAAGRLPGSDIRSLSNLFADHVSPITALFGLGWRVWPDPRSLIVVQSLALGLAAGVVGFAAARRLPARIAVPLGLATAVAKGVVSAGSFDVHETALGTPLMAGLAWALLERRRRWVLACSAGLLLVKEDLGLTVLVAAAIWWRLTRDRRTALVLVGLGLVGFAVSNAVLIWVNPDHQNPYLQFLIGGASGNPQGLAGALAAGGSRWAPALAFVLAAGVIGVRSPLAALALPTLAWRAASSNTSYWQTYFHYDALLVPIAAIALVDVLARLRRGELELVLGPVGGRRGRRGVAAGLAVLAAAGLAGSAWTGLRKVASWQPWDLGRYRWSEPVRDAAALGELIPRGAPVVAEQQLGPAVLARVDVRMLASTVPADGGWVLLSPDGDQLGAPQKSKRAWLAAQQGRPGVRVIRRGTVVLVQLPAVERVQLPR